MYQLAYMILMEKEQEYERWCKELDERKNKEKEKNKEKVDDN